MGIMDKLIKNEEEKGTTYKKVEKDKTLINTYFNLSKDNQNFNMTVKFLAFDDVFPDYNGILTRKIHYALFSKQFKEENGFEDVKSVGVVADIKYHGFADYNPLEDLKWSFYNAFKATGNEKYKKLSNKVQENEESYVYVYVVDSSDTDLIGKVFLYKIPIRIKKDYILAQYEKFQIDVFEDDIYCRIDGSGFGISTRWTSITDERKHIKNMPFEKILEKNGQILDDIKTEMKNIDITRYEFKEDEELEKMERIENVLAINLAPVWKVVTTYSRSKLKLTDNTKQVNTSSIDTTDTQDVEAFNIDADDDDELNIF